MSRIVAVIVAAGRGKRMQSDLPKQYLSLNGKSILHHCIKKFINHPKISDIICVINKRDINLYKEAICNLDILDPIFGGEERQDSVRFALKGIQSLRPDFVLIHDAVRPFVSNKIIEDLILAVKKYDSVIPAISINDTIKKIENNIVLNSVSRDQLYLTQTPQAFNYQLILDLHHKYQEQKLTDDASLCEYDKINIFTISGDVNNFKITNQQDYERAKFYINN